MASITVRGVADDVRDELAARAALEGRSLEEYLRRALAELARRPDAESLVSRVRARKRAAESRMSPERILEHRDGDRR